MVAREELELVLAHPDMACRRLPLLVLANKSDAPHALAPAQVAAGLASTTYFSSIVVPVSVYVCNYLIDCTKTFHEDRISTEYSISCSKRAAQI